MPDAEGLTADVDQRRLERWWVVDGGDGVDLLLPALVGFAVVAVESSFGVDCGGAVLGAGGAALGHRGGAVAGAGTGLVLGVGSG